jgi:uncharacterized protein YyaL (SSP411 family)
LDEAQYAAFASRYGLDSTPNFEGKWHLQIRATIENAAAAVGDIDSATIAHIEAARTRLLATRNERIWPGRDEKVLTAWNALMVKGLAVAGRGLGRPELVAAAEQAVEFIRSHLYVNGRLLACYKDGRARFPAYLDDYAFLLDALLELLQARWSGAHLKFAIELADTLLEQFLDAERGGFYFTSADHEKLAHRSRTFSDESLPSGNAIAAQALGRLGHLLGETRYLHAAEQTLRAGETLMADFPHGHASLITALDEYLEPPEIIIIRGAAAEAEDWSRQAGALFAPRRLIYAIPVDAVDLPGALASREAGATTRAYICKGTHCGLPLETLQELTAAVSEA